MRILIILNIVGGLILAVGACMALPLAYSLFHGDAALKPLALSLSTLLVGGFCLMRFCKGRLPHGGQLNPREGVATVALGWLVACLLGALPYVFAGLFPTFSDAVFESVSGFTTTGSTVLQDIEAVPRGLLLWRAMTHWLGGMGIIVLSLAFLPYLGMGGMQLYKAEVPGPTPDKLTPRLKDTAAVLWKVYFALTLGQVVLLSLGEMDIFEAVCHTFASVATGGFSTRNASLAAFGPYSQWVCTVFMFLAGVNFVLHFNLLRGRALASIRDEEFRLYFWIVVIASAALFVQRLPLEIGVEAALRVSVFQVVSIMTTTGFCTADFSLWAPLSQMVLLLLMFIGGSAGSTGGGVKCMRVLVLAKQVYQEVFTLVHPNSVRQMKVNGSKLPASVVNGCACFVALFIMLWGLSTLLLAGSGVDLATACTASLTCFANVGPGLGSVGPVDNFQHLSAFAKWLLSVDMLLGRLELFTIFLLCIPEFWRR